jgi:hypothetical protein
LSLIIQTLEVSLESEKCALAFDLKTCAADWLRRRIRQKIDTAEEAGIEKRTAIQRFCFNYAGAAKSSRLARAIPAGLVRWAAYVEYNATKEWFPKADLRSLGTFDKDRLRVLPHNFLLLRLGSVRFVGPCSDGVPNDLFEIRVGYGAGEKFICTLLSGIPNDEENRERGQPRPET